MEITRGAADRNSCGTTGVRVVNRIQPAVVRSPITSKLETRMPEKGEEQTKETDYKRSRKRADRNLV